MHVFGFIGFGSMGGMLVKGFVESGATSPDSIYVTRKDKSRLGEIKAAWPGIHTTENAWEVAEKADFIFICVKPLEYRGTLGEIGPFINPDIARVATKGGITEEGVKIIKRKLPQVFDELLLKTTEKRRTVGEKVEKDFCISP